MSSVERSISPDPLPRSQSPVQNDSNRNTRQSSSKRRRDSPEIVTRSPRSSVSRSRSRSSRDGSRSPNVRKTTRQRSVSPIHQSSSSSKRRHNKDVADSGRNICQICSKDVESTKRLYGLLDNCDHVFCYECIVSWKRSKYSNSDSESCPVCKVRSAFITPSKHWYENKDEKYRIIKKHRNHLKTLPCRYYLRHGFCRYSDRCFYDHHEAAKQYRQQHRHSRERDRDRDRHNGGRSHRSPSPSASRHSSSRYRERAY